MRLLAAARSILESSGSGWLHAYMPRPRVNDDVVAAMRSKMTAAPFDEAWARAWGESARGNLAMEFALEKPRPVFR